MLCRSGCCGREARESWEAKSRKGKGCVALRESRQIHRWRTGAEGEVRAKQRSGEGRHCFKLLLGYLVASAEFLE